MNKELLVLANEVIVNHIHNSAINKTLDEARLFHLRQKNTMPSMVGMATANAHGKSAAPDQM